jgi:hypothetical protein
MGKVPTIVLEQFSDRFFKIIDQQNRIDSSQCVAMLLLLLWQIEF